MTCNFRHPVSLRHLVPSIVNDDEGIHSDGWRVHESIHDDKSMHSDNGDKYFDIHVELDTFMSASRREWTHRYTLESIHNDRDKYIYIHIKLDTFILGG